jgi:hypothetical protein
VRSRTTAQFRSLRAALPKRVQEKAVAAYKLWSANPRHPSLRFKKIHKTLPIYSVRIDRAWRAVGVLEKDTVVWFWVGSHENYAVLLKRL